MKEPVRKSALAAANYHICLAGMGLANAGVPKDAPELKMLKEVLGLLKARAPDADSRKTD